MGKRRVSLATWIDLLGYGKKIGTANFDPNNPKAQKPQDRLRRFHDIVKENAETEFFPTLVLNDGVVAYRDLRKDDASDTNDFFHRSLKLYSKVNEQDCIGARMVLASGFRNLGSDAGNEYTRENLRKILDDYKNCCIDLDEATNKVYPFRPPYAIIPQLQENFAFARAYTAEKSGSGGKLAGPNFYVDLNIFKCTNGFKPHVEWSSDYLNLTIKFAKFQVDNNNFCESLMNNSCKIEELLEKNLEERNDLLATCKARIESLEDRIDNLECEVNQLHNG